MSQGKFGIENSKKVVVLKWTNIVSSGCSVCSSPLFVLFLSPIKCTLSRLKIVAGSQHGCYLLQLARRRLILGLLGSTALRRFEVLGVCTGSRCLHSKTRVDSIDRMALQLR